MVELTKREVILKRLVYYKEIISKTIISIQKYKLMDILSHKEYNLGITNLEKNNNELQKLEDFV